MGDFLQKVPHPFPNFLAPSRSAGCLRGGLVAADLVLFDGRRGGLVGIAVFGKRGGYGDAAGAGFESSLDEPADFMAAEPGGVRSEDDRDEARIAAPHGGNDIVAGSRDPAGFQAVGTGAGPEQRVFVRCDHPPVLEHADAVVLERSGIVLEVHVSKPRHISGCGVLPGGGQAVGRFERAGGHADLAGLVVHHPDEGAARTADAFGNGHRGVVAGRDGHPHEEAVQGNAFPCAQAHAGTALARGVAADADLIGEADLAGTDGIERHHHGHDFREGGGGNPHVGILGVEDPARPGIHEDGGADIQDLSGSAALGGVGFPGVPGFCGWGKDEGGGYKKESGHKRDSQEVAFGSQSGEHAGYAPETVSREMGKPDKNLIPAGLR